MTKINTKDIQSHEIKGMANAVLWTAMESEEMMKRYERETGKSPYAGKPVGWRPEAKGCQ